MRLCDTCPSIGCPIDAHKFSAVVIQPNISHLCVSDPLTHHGYENVFQTLAPLIRGRAVQWVDFVIVCASQHSLDGRRAGNDEGVIDHFVIGALEFQGDQLGFMRHIFHSHIARDGCRA